MKKIVAIVIAMVLLLAGCGSQNDGYTNTAEPTKNDVVENNVAENKTEEIKTAENKPADDKKEQKAERSHVKMTMADGGEIVIELIPEYAPATVENFLSLVKEGFYDGLIFHRVIPGFMIQGGDPEGTGMGGSNKNIKGEFASNGFNKNKLKHTRGVISMARAQHPDSASSQFFIMHQTSPHLDGDYAAFGKVISGMEVVDKIAMVETNENDKPLKDVVIESIRVIEE